MARYARIIGWGKYLPEKVLTNKELERLVNTTEAWILARTGIKERRIAADEETASSMAVHAARQALEVARLSPDSLDLVITATCTPDLIFPASAALVQHELGAKKAAAFDLNAACSGFIYALATASQFIASGTYNNILVLGSEVYSRILDWKDRSTCILFGDGAGA
ncbi:MAG TPA: 3-oxoacyl-ACP synthase, partial [Dehalococcoidia bacterium]|nr:3-oxoacyl-ACP synthase [Dehalococcoidia bacterium]